MQVVQGNAMPGVLTRIEWFPHIIAQLETKCEGDYLFLKLGLGYHD